LLLRFIDSLESFAITFPR